MTNTSTSEFLDTLKKSYPKVFSACVTQMKSNKGKKSSEFKPISFPCLLNALEVGVPESIASEFINCPATLRSIVLSDNKGLLYDKRLLAKLLDLKIDSNMSYTYTWLCKDLDCNEDFIFDVLSNVGTEEYIVENIHILDAKDFECINEAYESITTQNPFRRDSYMSIFVLTYVKFKKNKLNTTYLTDTIQLLGYSYIDMYIHTAKLYGDKFIDMMEILRVNPDMFEFQSAALAIICPGLFRGESSKIDKLNNAHLLAIVELHYLRTGEILSSDTLKLYEKIIHSLLSMERYSVSSELILVNYILIGSGLLTYGSMNLPEEELHKILKEGANYRLAYEECKKYKLISLKSPDLLEFRDKLLRYKKNKVHK